MARITVEDCLEMVDNRFQLVLMASQRGRQIARGGEPYLDWENDKPTVVALREIAAGKVGAEILDQPLAEAWEYEMGSPRDHAVNFNEARGAELEAEDDNEESASEPVRPEAVKSEEDVKPGDEEQQET